MIFQQNILKILFFLLFYPCVIFSMFDFDNKSEVVGYSLSSFGNLRSYVDLKELFNLSQDLLRKKIDLILDKSIEFELRRLKNKALWVEKESVFYGSCSDSETSYSEPVTDIDFSSLPVDSMVLEEAEKKKLIIVF
ncbi:MAG: hypothetical protein ABIF12_00660 [bacterium]